MIIFLWIGTTPIQRVIAEAVEREEQHPMRSLSNLLVTKLAQADPHTGVAVCGLIAVSAVQAVPPRGLKLKLLFV